jgi:hypothetical protein
MMPDPGNGLVVSTAGNDDLDYYLGNVPCDVVEAAAVL